MAQIVVIEQAHRSGQNVAQRRQLQRMHLRVRHKQPKLLVQDVQLEQRSAANDLQPRQHDVHVDMADQHVAGHLADVLQKAEIQLGVLQPRQLQIAVHVRAVRVAIAQIAEVMVAIRWHRHATVGADTDCRWDKQKEQIVSICVNNKIEYNNVEWSFVCA